MALSLQLPLIQAYITCARTHLDVLNVLELLGIWVGVVIAQVAHAWKQGKQQNSNQDCLETAGAVTETAPTTSSNILYHTRKVSYALYMHIQCSRLGGQIGRLDRNRYRNRHVQITRQYRVHPPPYCSAMPKSTNMALAWPMCR